jgi:hypothetical protein
LPFGKVAEPIRKSSAAHAETLIENGAVRVIKQHTSKQLIMSGENVTEAELINELHRLYTELSKVPSFQEMNDYSQYSVYTYSQVFGSWNDAIEAAGYTPRTDRESRSKKELRSELKRLADSNDNPPSKQEMLENGSISPTTYSSRFGSWNAALEAAGFSPRTQGQQITDDALRFELSRLTEELGQKPTTTDMAEKGSYSPGTYIRRFGSWGEALKTLNSESA